MSNTHGENVYAKLYYFRMYKSKRLVLTWLFPSKDGVFVDGKNGCYEIHICLGDMAKAKHRQRKSLNVFKDKVSERE